MSNFAVTVGDCREVLAPMEALSVDAVITDVPYGEVTRDSQGLRVLDKGAADVLDFDLADVLPHLVRIARGSVYVWCGWEQVSPLVIAFRAAGLSVRSCVWWKSDPSPMNGESLWLSAVEHCVFARKPGAYFARHCAPPVWRGPVERGVDWHPTPKPVWLMRELVEASVPPGGSVLDPFMGSGSVGVAAVSAGRTFTGIERNAEWAERARRRIHDAPLSLFAA